MFWLRVKSFVFVQVPEYRELLVDIYDCLYKVIIIYTAHKVSEEVPPNLWSNASEDKLKKIQDTWTHVTPAKVLEHKIGAEIARLQLGPEGSGGDQSVNDSR